MSKVHLCSLLLIDYQLMYSGSQEVIINKDLKVKKDTGKEKPQPSALDRETGCQWPSCTVYDLAGVPYCRYSNIFNDC